MKFNAIISHYESREIQNSRNIQSEQEEYVTIRGNFIGKKEEMRKKQISTTKSRKNRNPMKHSYEINYGKHNKREIQEKLPSDGIIYPPMMKNPRDKLSNRKMDPPI